MRMLGDVDLKMAWAVWVRNFTVYRHTWMMNILPNFFEPVFYLLGMGLGLGMYVSRTEISGIGPAYSGEYAFLVFIGQGLLAASAMNGSVFEATYNMFVKMYFGKLYDAFLSTPAQLQDIAIGELLWGITRSLIYGGTFLLILLGFTLAGVPMITSPTALLIPFLIIIIGAMFGLIGQLFTSIIKVIDLYTYFYTLFLTPMFLFSGIFFPLDRIPYGHEIAMFTPLYHAVRLMRACATGFFELGHVGDLGYILGVIVVLLWFVPRRMRKRMIH